MSKIPITSICVYFFRASIVIFHTVVFSILHVFAFFSRLRLMYTTKLVDSYSCIVLCFI